MRIRGSHIAALVTALIVGSVMLVIWRDRNLSGDGIDTVAKNVRVPAAGEASDSVPIIELETYHFHAGTIPNTGFTEVEVKIFNKGKADLKIQDVQTTCACSIGYIKKEYNPIPPGGEGILNIRLEPRRMFGFHSLKTLTIQSNDAVHPNVQLQVEADVEPEYELVPAELDMGDMEKGDDTTASLILRQLREEPIGITAVKEVLPEEVPQDDYAIDFAFELLPEDQWKNPGKEEYRITARQAPLCPGGPFDRRFSIESSIDRAPHYIPVRGNVRAPYLIKTGTPGFVFIGPPPDGGPLQGRVVISSESDFAVTSTNVDATILSVDVDQADPSQDAIMTVRAGQSIAPGQILEFFYFTIRLDGKDYRERMAVRGVLSPTAG